MAFAGAAAQLRGLASSPRARQHVPCLVAARARPSGYGAVVGGHSPTSPKGWEVMRTALQAAGVKLISPQEVQFAAERGGVTIVDVRPASDFVQGHLPGAVNVSFFRPISGWGGLQIARRVGYALFGVLQGTEVNPEFAADVQRLLAEAPPGQALVLYCAQGGVLESTPSLKNGWQTRSLIAAYDLLQAGVRGLSVMRGGYSEWVAGGRDIEVFVESEDEEAEPVQSGPARQ